MQFWQNNKNHSTDHTIWAFGCSFTAGQGYNLSHWREGNFVGILDQTDEEYLEYETNSEELNTHWLNVLRDTIFLEDKAYFSLKNYGQGGISRKSVLDTIYANIHKINYGDIVIIGVTGLGRRDLLTNYQVGSSEELRYVGIGLHGHTLEEYKSILASRLSGLDEDLISLIAEHTFYTSLDTETMDRLERGELVHNFRDGKELDYTFREYFVLDVYKNIKRVLERLGVTVLIWDNRLWFYKHLDVSQDNVFESIEEWSNGEIKDNHWSYNGNVKFGKFLKWCLDVNIDEEDTILGKGLVERYYEAHEKCMPTFTRYSYDSNRLKKYTKLI